MSIQRIRQITMYICTTAMIVLGIYDLIVVNTHGADASISRFMQESMFSSPIVSFTCGALFGHFILYFRPKWKDSELLISEMASRLEEVEEIGFDKEEKVYYWRSCGTILAGQCNRKNLGEKK